MKKIIVLFIITSIFPICVVHTQTYYGKGLFGKFDIINDTICTLCFLSNFGNEIDTCLMRKNNDTIVISSKESWRCKVNIYDEYQIETPIKDIIEDIIIVKQYNYSFSNKKYEYVGEYLGIYDSITKTYILRRGSLPRGNYILVFKHIFSYSRIKCDIDSYYNNYIGLELNPLCSNGKILIFNEFKLLIKGDKLVPIDKEQQTQCWLDNGFLFPKMKLSNKNKKFKIIKGNYIGLMNMPTEFMSESKLSKPLQKKYMEYLNK